MPDTVSLLLLEEGRTFFGDDVALTPRNHTHRSQEPRPPPRAPLTDRSDIEHGRARRESLQKTLSVGSKRGAWRALFREVMSNPGLAQTSDSRVPTLPSLPNKQADASLAEAAQRFGKFNVAKTVTDPDDAENSTSTFLTALAQDYDPNSGKSPKSLSLQLPDDGCRASNAKSPSKSPRPLPPPTQQEPARPVPETSRRKKERRSKIVPEHVLSPHVQHVAPHLENNADHVDVPNSLLDRRKAHIRPPTPTRVPPILSNGKGRILPIERYAKYPAYTEKLTIDEVLALIKGSPENWIMLRERIMEFEAKEARRRMRRGNFMEKNAAELSDWAARVKRVYEQLHTHNEHVKDVHSHHLNDMFERFAQGLLRIQGKDKKMEKLRHRVAMWWRGKPVHKGNYFEFCNFRKKWLGWIMAVSRLACLATHMKNGRRARALKTRWNYNAQIIQRAYRKYAVDKLHRQEKIVRSFLLRAALRFRARRRAAALPIILDTLRTLARSNRFFHTMKFTVHRLRTAQRIMKDYIAITSARLVLLNIQLRKACRKRMREEARKQKEAAAQLHIVQSEYLSVKAGLRKSKNDDKARGRSEEKELYAQVQALTQAANAHPIAISMEVRTAVLLDKLRELRKPHYERQKEYFARRRRIEARMKANQEATLSDKIIYATVLMEAPVLVPVLSSREAMEMSRDAADRQRTFNQSPLKFGVQSVAMRHAMQIDHSEAPSPSPLPVEPKPSKSRRVSLPKKTPRVIVDGAEHTQPPTQTSQRKKRASTKSEDDHLAPPTTTSRKKRLPSDQEQVPSTSPRRKRIPSRSVDDEDQEQVTSTSTRRERLPSKSVDDEDEGQHSPSTSPRQPSSNPVDDDVQEHAPVHGAQHHSGSEETGDVDNG